MLVKEQ